MTEMPSNLLKVRGHFHYLLRLLLILYMLRHLFVASVVFSLTQAM